jgi:hypothetical protein
VKESGEERRPVGRMGSGKGKLDLSNSEGEVER